ncbi:Protein of unknown function DUF262 [Actinokineospora alba]|uniref:GmrSD restriction endonucleases N-terminal domain-containing protein n=1 Tax=Actinokineospora alba TaxID=504798 RepID=A0A1H0T6B1_9PSEU|nr:DUF262 domain-containing protein [Actinokineospora alba]TDP66346.1 uncharacterized protein DUF262 [Actinokineospora alba]SDJ22540.1 Protein of unknown function DUF262 [Actinokineospora alba]SDP49573.1 Protein of unknown function DUF262 [Actinokineospora alba]
MQRTEEYPQRFLEVTHHTVSWFWQRLQNDELDMRPPFQRNPVWQVRQKALLIDSILRGFPVPELYIQTNVNGEGEESHVVVDGQQRIRACLEFLTNKFPLGDESDHLGGLKFEQLPSVERRRIFEYKFVVRVLPELSNEKVREIFGRLNINNIALNRQEIRHATYWGDFISCMEEISRRTFWLKSGIFSSNDIRRMNDVEYVSELAIGVLFGPQNKKANLDHYYAAFEEEFPDRPKTESIFSSVLGELEQLATWPNKLRWSRKVDFYSLFLVLGGMVSELPLDRTERALVSGRLVDFSMAVNRLVSVADDRKRNSDEVDARTMAYARSVRNSSDLSSRRTRVAALDAFLRGKPISFEPTQVRTRDPLRSLPSAEILMSRTGEILEDE